MKSYFKRLKNQDLQENYFYIFWSVLTRSIFVLQLWFWSQTMHNDISFFKINGKYFSASNLRDNSIIVPIPGQVSIQGDASKVEPIKKHNCAGLGCTTLSFMCENNRTEHWQTHLWEKGKGSKIGWRKNNTKQQKLKWEIFNKNKSK